MAETTSSNPERDLKVLAALADLKESLARSGADTDMEHAILRELEAVEARLKESARTLWRGALDEVRLQAHLAVLDAHDRIARLEPLLRRVLGPLAEPRHVLAELGEAKVHAVLAGMQLRDAVEERERRARHELADAERATERALERLGDRIDALTQDLRGRP